MKWRDYVWWSGRGMVSEVEGLRFGGVEEAYLMKWRQCFC